jgi:hypothetical protein
VSYCLSRCQLYVTFSFAVYAFFAECVERNKTTQTSCLSLHPQLSTIEITHHILTKLGNGVNTEVCGPNLILVRKGKKVKVKLSLCLTKHLAMKMYGGVEVYIHVFLTSALDGGEWLASRSGRFTTGERTPVTH